MQTKWQVHIWYKYEIYYLKIKPNKNPFSKQFEVSLQIKSLLMTNNNYRILFHGKERVCNLIKNTFTHVLISPVFKFIKPYTNVLDNNCKFRAGVIWNEGINFCTKDVLLPFFVLSQENYYLKDLPLVGGIIPFLMPTGRYKGTVSFWDFQTNKTFANVTWLLENTNKPMEFWWIIEFLRTCIHYNMHYITH